MGGVFLLYVLTSYTQQPNHGPRSLLADNNWQVGNVESRKWIESLYKLQLQIRMMGLNNALGWSVIKF